MRAEVDITEVRYQGDSNVAIRESGSALAAADSKDQHHLAAKMHLEDWTHQDCQNPGE